MPGELKKLEPQQRLNILCKLILFVLPTGKFCRILYLGDTYFLHRDAFRGCFYQEQIYSHDTRKMIKQYESVFALDKYSEEIKKPYFKSHYKGQPTRRYQKLLDLERRTYYNLFFRN